MLSPFLPELSPLCDVFQNTQKQIDELNKIEGEKIEQKRIEDMKKESKKNVHKLLQKLKHGGLCPDIDESYIDPYYTTELNNQFIHDLKKAFFFGKRNTKPLDFYDLLIPMGPEYITDLSDKFSNVSLEHMKIELENILSKEGYSLRITFKNWVCACPGKYKFHRFPTTVCPNCGVGIKMYDPYFGVVTIKE